MRRDRCANERIVVFEHPVTRTAAAYTSTEFDLRAGPAGAVWSGREIPTNMLLVVNMSGTITTGATLDIVIHTGDVSGALTSFATCSQMAWDTNTLWIAEIRDLQRYIHLVMTVAGASLAFTCHGNFDRSRREPIYQTANESTVTYNKNPATG